MSDRTLTQILTLDLAHIERLELMRQPDTSLRLTWRRYTASPDRADLDPTHRYRAPALLAATSPPAWLGDAIRSRRPHPAALALGLHGIDYDGAGWVYLSAYGVLLSADTPVLIVEAHTTQAQRVALAVDRLRQADLPAEAERLQQALSTQRDTDATLDGLAKAGRAVTPLLARHAIRLAADQVVATVEAHAKIHPKPTNAPGLWSWVEMVELLRLI